MTIVLTAGLAALTLATAPQTATSCQPRLGDAAQAASELPGETDYRITDRLAELYEQALEVEFDDPARCLGFVAEMEALMTGAGRRGDADGGGGAGSGGGASTGGEAAPLETMDGRRVAETEVPPVPPLERGLTTLRPPNAFTEAVETYWIGSAVHERGQLLAAGTDYIHTLRDVGETVLAESEDQDMRRRDAQVANALIHAVEVYQHVVLVNEPEDQLAARQADALRRVRQASRRALAQWARRPLEDEEPFEPAPLVRDEDYLAPLTPRPSGEDYLAPLVRGDGGDGADLLAPLTPREDRGFLDAVRGRMAQAEAEIDDLTRRLAYWIEDREYQ